MLPTCDGCGAPFTITHALDCHVGGLVARRRNEVRDAFGNLDSLVWNQVHREPIVRESHDAADGSALVADLCVQGLNVMSCLILESWIPMHHRTVSYDPVLSCAQQNLRNIYKHVMTAGVILLLFVYP